MFGVGIKIYRRIDVKGVASQTKAGADRILAFVRVETFRSETLRGYLSLFNDRSVGFEYGSLPP